MALQMGVFREPLPNFAQTPCIPKVTMLRYV